MLNIKTPKDNIMFHELVLFIPFLWIVWGVANGIYLISFYFFQDFTIPDEAFNSGVSIFLYPIAIPIAVYIKQQIANFLPCDCPQEYCDGKAAYIVFSKNSRFICIKCGKEHCEAK